MALSLAIVDDQDASGGTATVTGSDSAQTVTVYVSPVHKGNAPLTWTSAGSRSGDGTLSVSTAPGMYFAYAVGTVGSAPAVSPPVIFQASRDSESVHQRILDAIQAAVQTLTLSHGITPPGNITAERVYQFPTLDYDVVLEHVTFPCVVISTGLEQYRGGTNERDDILYPAVVSILDRAMPQYTPPYPAYRRYREQISRFIRNQRLSGVSEVFTVNINPLPPTWKPGTMDVYVSSLQFMAMVRDPRGV